MKIKKIIAALSCTALMVAAAMPLAACGNKDEGKFKTTTLSLSDYAAEKFEPNVDSYGENSSNSKTAATTLAEVKGGYSGTALTSVTNSVYCAARKSGEATVYDVYNGRTGKLLLDGVEYAPQGIGGYFINKVVTGKGTDDEKTTYDVHASDGTKLVGGLEDWENDLSVEPLNNKYIENKKGTYTVLKVRQGGIASTEYKYFVNEQDEYGNAKFSTIPESQIQNVNEENKAGADKFVAARKLSDVYGATEEKPIQSDLASYSVKNVGKSVVFYNGGTETGRVNLENGIAAGYVGNNYYYYTMVTLSKDKAEDANLIMVREGTEVNYTYTLHKYDIVGNTDTVVKLNAMPSQIKPVYNYTTKAYDAAFVTGYNVENRVLQASSFKYMVDAELAVGFDCTGMVGSSFELSKFGDGKFIYKYNGDYKVVDDKFEPVSAFEDVKYYENENLFGFSGSNDYYGFANAEGKVVIEPKYRKATYSYQSGSTMVIAPTDGEIEFYGGYAFVVDASGDALILKSDGTTTKADEYTVTTPADDENKVATTVQTSYGYGLKSVYEVKTDTENPENSTIKFAIYTYGGTPIKDISYNTAKLTTADVSPYNAVRMYASNGRGLVSVVNIVEKTGEDPEVTYTLYNLK